MSEATVSQAKLAFQMRVTEDVEGVASASTATIIHKDFDEDPLQVILTATSTPAVTKHSGELYTLGTGDTTIDLTDLQGSQENIDGTDLKVIGLRFQVPSTNTGAVKIKPGAANGYALFGAGNDIELPVPLQQDWATLMVFFDEGLADIDATHKTLDVEGTAADTFRLQLILGPLTGT